MDAAICAEAGKTARVQRILPECQRLPPVRTVPRYECPILHSIAQRTKAKGSDAKVRLRSRSPSLEFAEQVSASSSTYAR
jgi:hypothetical protein